MPKGRPGRALDALRLGLVAALRRAQLSLPDAVTSADAWLLTSLAAERLELAGAPDALAQARRDELGPMSALVARVAEATGLPLAPSAGSRGVAETQRIPHNYNLFKYHDEVSPELFADLGGDDPFAALAQRLRARRLVESEDGALALEPNEARRDEGGYYTSFKLARRLAARALGELDEVPAIIDPACGAGTFLAAAFDVLFTELERRRRADPSRSIEPVAWTVAALHGVEPDATALFAARLSLAVRAVRAERALKGAGQLSLFGQAQTYGPLIVDRLRLGDSLGEAPADRTPGTERLRLRLLARDEPGRLPSSTTARPVRWDAEFPLRLADEEGVYRAGGGFDVVLTNPPFVPVDRIAPERRKALLQSLETAQRRFDLFIGFVERALTLLASGGRATLLVPRTFLTEANAERARALLLERTSLERIEELGPVPFDAAKVECVALTFVLRRPAEGSTVELVRRGERHPTAVPQNVFRRFPRSMLRVEVADPNAAECLQLAEKSVPLGRYFCASWGARGTPVKEFHLDAPSHPLAKPMLKGDDVSPFVARQSTRCLLYDVARLYRPSVRALFESPKVVVRKVSGRAGLVAAVDEGGHYTDDSLVCVARKADLASVPIAQRKRHGLRLAPHQLEPSRAYDLHLVAALLQTPLVQTYFRVQLGGGLNVFPGLVEALPLPRPEALAMSEAKELARLGRQAARGKPFPLDAADRLARALYGLDASPGAHGGEAGEGSSARVADGC